MTPTPKQQEIINDLHRFKVLVCGRKFGKTEIGVETVLGEALERPNKDLIYIASTFTEARDIVWNRMKKRYAPILVGEPNEARLEMKLRDLKGIGSSLLQLKSWEAVESLRGREFDYVIMDEIQNYKSFWTLYQEVLRPTLMPRKGRALFEGTPKGFNHLYDLFNLEGKDLSFKSFKFNSYDNPYLPKEEIDEMRQQMSEDKFAQECLAEFRKMEGLVYKEFDREKHLVDELPQAFQEVIGGVDFGFTNPAAVLTIKKDLEGCYWVMDEWYKVGKTDSEIADYVTQCKFNKVYPDPESAGGIQELKNRGCNVREVVKGKDSVKNGIDRVRALLKNNQLKISRSCINLTSEFESYCYPDKKDSRNMEEYPIKENDHALDALRYALVAQDAEKLQRATAHIFIPQW